jgi:hypothetical protein
MILCADDYGLRDDIDSAILELCAARRLSAVSCMVGLDRCDPARLKTLLLHQQSVDIGLHLCFTDEGLPWSGAAARSRAQVLPSYGTLLKRALTGQIKPEEMLEWVAVQYELFLQKAGRGPDHIDGHLHAHQLPGIREAVMNFVLSLPERQRPYVRNTATSLRSFWRRRLPWRKAALIGAFGATLRRRLRRAGVRTNQGFAGVYDFAQWRRYSEYLPGWADCLAGHPDGIIVVHPGKTEEWRKHEYLALQGFPFPPGTPNRFKAET